MRFKSLLAYLFILIFLVWCVITFQSDIAQIRFDPIWHAWDAVLLAGVLSLGNYLLRVLRWRIYLSHLGHVLPTGLAGLTYIAGFAFTLSPGKVGELARGHYYQKIGIPLSRTAAAFFVERLMDLLAMLALVFLAAASVTAYDTLIWLAAAAILVLLLVLGLAPWSRIADRVEEGALLSGSLKKAAQGMLRMLQSAKALLTPGMLLAGFSLGLLSWGAEGVGLMVLGALAPHVPIDWATATGIYAVAIIVGAISFLPGGLGGTEVVMIALLAAHGYALPDAILMTLVCRLLTLWLAVLLGWLAVFLLRRNPRLKEST